MKEETREEEKIRDETRDQRRRRDRTEEREDETQDKRRSKWREEKRREEKRREKTRREKKQDKRRDKMKREREMKRGEFEQKNVSRPSNPPDELAQNVSKKNPFRTNYSSIFSAKVQNLAVFSFIYMIRIRFFGPQELIQKYFRRAR